MIQYPKIFRKRIIRYMPLAPETRVALERFLRGREEFLRLRRSDAVVLAYEKSGRTWLRVMLTRYFELLYRLQNPPLLDYDNLYKLNADIPKVAFTHTRYLDRFMTSKSIGRELFHERPVVLLARDPRDVAVSMYHQWLLRIKPRNMAIYGMPARSPGVDVNEFVLNSDFGVPAIIRFLNAWIEESRRTGRIQVFQYESLRKHTTPTLTRLLTHIGETPEPELVKDVVAYAAFGPMQARERAGAVTNTRLVAGDISNPNSFKARKAMVGGYRDELDPRTVATLDTWVEDGLDPEFGYGGTAGQVSMPAVKDRQSPA